MGADHLDPSLIMDNDLLERISSKQADDKAERQRSRNSHGKPTDIELLPNQVLESVKLKRRKVSLRMLLDPKDSRAVQRFNKYLDFLRAGVSMQAAAGQIGIRADRAYSWYRRGEQGGAGSKWYRLFYRKTHKALQESTAIAETEVKSQNPMAWLSKGPGRLINEGWSDPDKVDMQLVGKIEQQVLAIPQKDILLALAELRAAGIMNIGDIVDGQSRNVTEEEMDEEFGDDGDGVAASGTNYIGDGKWESSNPSIPSSLGIQQTPPRLSYAQSLGTRTDAVDANGGVHSSAPRQQVVVDQEIFDQTDGQVTTPVLLSASERLAKLLMK